MTVCTGQFTGPGSNPVCTACGLDRFAHIEIEETIAQVWAGTLERQPITWAEAERIARQTPETDHLPFGIKGARD